MPVIISDGLVLAAAAAEITLAHPRILADDVFSIGTLAATTEADGFPKENVADFFTFDFWRPTALPARIEVTLDEAQEIDYLMIAAHSLGSVGCSAKPQYHNGTTWVDLAAETAPGSDRVLAFLFEAVTTNRVGVLVAGAGAMPSLGIVMAGKALAVERKLWRGHRPIVFSEMVTAKPQISEAGQWLGRSIRREGVKTTIALKNLTATWMRAQFRPFITRAKKYPFGWIWRPDLYPDDVALVWEPSGQILPTNAGPRDLMAVSFDVEGHLE